MALTVGVNSYVDLVYALAYAEERDGTEGWISLTPEEQEKTLVSATDGIDTLIFVGQAADPTQELCWPRNATYWDPKVGNSVTISNETPEEVKKAQVEWAIDIGVNGGFAGADTGSSGGIPPDSISVGSISLSGLSPDSSTYTVGKIAIPPIVMNLIDHLLLSNVSPNGGVGKPFWRAW